MSDPGGSLDVPDQIGDQFKLRLVALAGVGGDLAEHAGGKAEKADVHPSSAIASGVDFIASIVADATFRTSSATGLIAASRHGAGGR
ncbi:MAG: hypothetical protein WA743_10695 [Pseudolabrys sp.]